MGRTPDGPPSGTPTSGNPRTRGRRPIGRLGNASSSIPEDELRDLTQRQKDILRYILDQINGIGRFPSFREIGKRFGLQSVATVAQHLKAIEDKGFLDREGRKLMPAAGLLRDRGIRILGHVAAGQPIEAEENYDGELRWEDFCQGETFAVRVRGDSMIDEGILEGDFVVVQRGETARSGDLVVAYVDEDYGVTVKRYFRKPDHVELRPANDAYQPIIIPHNHASFALAGRVVGIVRRI